MLNKTLSLNDITVLIVGDVMLDEYVYGSVSRFSPEAPVPIIDVESRSYSLGGAANVANNVFVLGAKPVLCSAVGNDENGVMLKNMLTSINVPVSDVISVDSKQTIVKQRFMVDGKQLFRADYEDAFDLDSRDASRLIDVIENVIANRKPNVIIIQDYDKGVMTNEVIASVLNLADKNNIKVFVDPKKRNFDKYQGAFLFKPNEKEFSDYLGKKLDDDTLEEDMKKFQEKFNIRNFLLTRGEKGMVLSENFGEEYYVIPSEVRSIADVTGAGDTVISTFTVICAADVDLKNCASIANVAAGMVCEKSGVACVTIDDLLEKLS